jgi:hypothetical protein
MPHPLHEVVAELLSANLPEGASLFVDKACKGNQRIPLFGHQQGGREHSLCCVDALMTIDGRIRLIVEIEESNVKPTQIAGKFLTAALAKFYLHHPTQAEIPQDDHVSFLQVVSTKKLKSRSKKIRQFKNIKDAIRNNLPIGNIRTYGMYPGDKCDFLLGGKHFGDVIDFVHGALGVI